MCDLPGSPRPAHASPAKQQELKAQRGALRRRRNLAKTPVGSPAGRSWCAQPQGAVGAGGSVLVDAEEPHAVELGQLGQEDAEQGGRVDHEVCGVVLGVEAGEEVQHHRGDAEELARGGALHPVVDLLPVREEAIPALVRGFKRGPLHCVQQQVHHQVVQDVGERPDHGDAEHGDAEQDDVQGAHRQPVGQPAAAAARHARVGVQLAVRHAHVHPAGGTGLSAAFWGRFPKSLHFGARCRAAPGSSPGARQRAQRGRRRCPELAELKQECLARGLEAKGNKQDLINRLQAYLEEHAEEEANEEDVLGEEIEEEEQKPAEPPVKVEEPPVKPPDVNTEKKVVKITSEISQMERMQKRAERFNVPVSLESKKAARAARFGLATVSTKGLSADSKPTVNMDKLKERAQRFGLNVSSLSKKSEEDEKLKKRKERFGIVTSSAGAGATEDTEAKKRKRAERFGIV